jgi:hypothetical protein
VKPLELPTMQPHHEAMAEEIKSEELINENSVEYRPSDNDKDVTVIKE